MKITDMSYEIKVDSKYIMLLNVIIIIIIQPCVDKALNKCSLTVLSHVLILS